MLNNETRPSRTSSKRKLLLPLVLLLVLTLLGGGLRFAKVPAQTPEPTQSQQREQGNDEPTITMDESDQFIFDNGIWMDSKKGKGIPSGTVVQGTRGTFRLEVKDGIGTVVRLTGDGSSGNGRYIEFKNGGNFIGVSLFQISQKEKWRTNDVFIFSEGVWKNELKDKELPAGTVIQGSTGSFRLDVEDEEGYVVNVAGASAMGNGKYIRLSHGGNAIVARETPLIDPLVPTTKSSYQPVPGAPLTRVRTQTVEHSAVVSPSGPPIQRDGMKPWEDYIIEPTDVLKALVSWSNEVSEYDLMVGPDGFVSFGAYGRVRVGGLTVEESQNVIESLLSKPVEKHVQVHVDVQQMNSKKFYVVMRYQGGDRVMMFPCTGNDTVMGALTNLQEPMRKFDIRHVRPSEGEPSVTPLQWDKVLMSKPGFGDNLQLLPDDRIFLEEKGKVGNVMVEPNQMVGGMGGMMGGGFGGMTGGASGFSNSGGMGGMNQQVSPGPPQR